MVPIRNVRRAIRPEMANKRGSVNWYQTDFHMSKKSLTIKIFFCCPTVMLLFFYCFLIQMGKPKKKLKTKRNPDTKERLLDFRTSRGRGHEKN